MNELVGGSAAGLAQTLVGYPFDTVKVHRVAHAHAAPRVWDTVTQLYRRHGGWRAFYRGVWSPMAGSVVVNAHTFCAYAALKKHCGLSPLAAGSVIGATLAVWETPMDMVKSRMQLARRHMTYGQCMRQGHMFRGLGVTTLRNGLSVGLLFEGYEKTRNIALRANIHPLAASFTGGVVAGFMCWAVPYPLDNIKTRIQTGRHWRNLPLASYYRGFSPCVIRAVVVNPFIFLAYEAASQLVQTHD